MIEKYKIRQRDRLILEVLYGMKVCGENELAWLCGMSDHTYMRKKLHKMAEQKLVRITRNGQGQNCYYLTVKGLRECDHPNAREYEISANTSHELDVAKVAAWLYITTGIAFGEIKTDVMLRSMQPGRKKHRPDLVTGCTCFEIERSHKSQQRVNKAVAENEQQYAQQVWVLPKHRPSIRRLVETAARNTAARVEILYLDDVEAELARADIHRNGFRVLPSSELVQAESVQKSKDESVLSKYFGGE